MPFNSARIVSVGTAVPETVVTNDDLAKMVDTSDEWIVTRTGIKTRRMVSPEHPQDAADLGSAAGKVALEKAGVSPESIDAVLCATFTPDYFFPSTACRIQDALGCANACAYDILAACSGFVFALSSARAMILSGQAKRVLVVGSEIISRSLDFSDRSTCILFGDGAGAAVVDGVEEQNTGILTTYLRSNGAYGDILKLPAWGERRTMTMKGNEVFKHAVRLMSEAVVNVCSSAGVDLSAVDYIVPHQANIRIIKGIAEKLDLSMDKVVHNVARYGNTSSASIPLALDEAIQDGRIAPGSLVALTALGGGITLGSALIRF